MAARPFSYNPTQATITGTTNVGTLCVGVSALDYSSKPGGLTWWMGPDEDNSYVICKDVPAQNFPTPVGASGGVQFWRSTNTNEEFRSLVQAISGTSQATADAANIWLISNGYWSSRSFDSDAQAFINTAGITGATEQYAVSNLVLGLKSDDLWTKMLAVYPFVGGTASTHKWNLKDPRDQDAAFRLTFHGGIPSGPNGITPNGTNGYADTKFVPGTSSWTTASSSISFYSRTNNNNGSNVSYGTKAGNDTRLYPIINTLGASIFHNQTNAISPAAPTTTALNFISSRINITQIIVAYNGTTSTTSSAVGNLSSNSIYLGAANFGGTTELFSNRELAFAHIGTGLTAGQCTQLYTRIQAFQTTLGRQV